MFSRFFISLLVGLAIGAAAGLYIGWELLPTTYVNSPASSLDQRFKDNYTVMIAAGFCADNDALGAVDRLRVLGVQDVPTYIQETTERYIRNSRNINDIYYLVALSEGVGRLTGLMQPYRDQCEGPLQAS